MLSASEKANIQTHVKAGLTPSQTSEILCVSSNVLLSQSSALCVSESLEHREHSPSGLLPTTKATTTDKLFANLEKEGHDHTVLLSRGALHSNPGVQTSNFLASPPPATPDDFASSLPPHERVLMEAFVAKHRSSREVPVQRDMFLAVVWMTTAERSLFRKFPHVVKLDVTFKTNSRGIPFLTVTGKTSDNEIFTILRCFVPNEQAWIFRWLLLTALPVILGKDIQRIRMIISDGDSQEITQINNLIDCLKTKARRQRCAWHVDNRSWDRLVRSVPKAGKTPMKRLLSSETTRKTIFQWMCSWMTKACQTKDEHEVSKKLFVHFLESEPLLKKLGEDTVESVKTMCRTAVHPHENNCAFHVRQKVFAFEEFTNTTQEASFSAVKFGQSALNSSMDLDTSVQKLNAQAERCCLQSDCAFRFVNCRILECYLLCREQDGSLWRGVNRKRMERFPQRLPIGPV